MPLPPPTVPEQADRRITAARARQQRARRVWQLRRQVLAASAATFALAFGLVAFDGSMGAQASSSATVTRSSQQAQQAQADDFGDDGGLGQDTAPAAAPAPVTSSQS